MFNLIAGTFDCYVSNYESNLNARDGNLHPLILYNGNHESELEQAKKLAGEILRTCIEMGGSITGEHGVGMEKRNYMPEMFGEIDRHVMHTIRHATDIKTQTAQASVTVLFPTGDEELYLPTILQGQSADTFQPRRGAFHWSKRHVCVIMTRNTFTHRWGWKWKQPISHYYKKRVEISNFLKGMTSSTMMMLRMICLM